jgi:hypothetical protein
VADAAFGRFDKVKSDIFFDNGDPVRFLALLFDFAVLSIVFLPTFSLSISSRRAHASVDVKHSASVHLILFRFSVVSFGVT